MAAWSRYCSSPETVKDNVTPLRPVAEAATA
jgi:hypothetical protein